MTGQEGSVKSADGGREVEDAQKTGNLAGLHRKRETLLWRCTENGEFGGNAQKT